MQADCAGVEGRFANLPASRLVATAACDGLLSCGLDPPYDKPPIALTEPAAPSLGPSLSRRAAFAAFLAVAVAWYVVAIGRTNPGFVSDFDQVWAGARALWQGKDPYMVVGPGREFAWKWPLYYPLPALVAVAPLGLLPVIVARALFAAATAGALAWAVTRDGWSRLPIFISVSFLVTVELGQWSSLYAAAFYLPALGFFGVAKPNFGCALAASASRRSTLVAIVLGALALAMISQIVQPGWYGAWLQNVRDAPHFQAPVVRPLGFLLLLAALRWRRPEARWLLALSIIPQPPSFYDQLLLVAVCRSLRESLVYAASTAVLFFYVGFNTPQPDYLSWGRLVGNATVWICYFPALILVLRRPNEGQIAVSWSSITGVLTRVTRTTRPAK